MKKYTLTRETRHLGDSTLYRIQALRSFGDVKEGEKGGWIAGSWNLAQEGDAWVAEDACVFERAYVSGDARISGDALLFGQAQLTQNAYVTEQAWISGDATVSGDACVFGKARVESRRHVLWLSHAGLLGQMLTAYTIRSGGVRVNVAHYRGTPEGVAGYVQRDHGGSPFAREMAALVPYLRARFAGLTVMEETKLLNHGGDVK